MDAVGLDARTERLVPGHPLEIHKEAALGGTVGHRPEGIDHLATDGIAARTDGGPRAHVDLPGTTSPHELDGPGDDLEGQAPPPRVNGGDHR